MSSKPLSQMLATPLGDMVAEIGKGIAQAQFAIDAQALASLREMYALDDETVKQLQGIGYRPTWYVIPEAEIELKLALTVGQSTTESGSSKTQLFGSTVDASYQNQFDFNYQASSSLKLKFSPVPAPVQIDDMQVVPQVAGLTLAAARQIFERLNMDYKADSRLKDDKLISRIEPAAGSLIEQDETVVLF